MRCFMSTSGYPQRKSFNTYMKEKEVKPYNK